MPTSYSPDTIRELARRFDQQRLHRPLRLEHYETGDELVVDVTGVVPAYRARLRMAVEKFVGGGFAGQVYRVTVMSIDAAGESPAGLEVGRRYAMKILIPPSSSSRRFRDLIYKIGFQAPFQLEVNPDAARSGALWQKFIRAAAADRFGDEESVKDVYATFVDRRLGACGEISDWVDGRTWRFEVDDRLSDRKRWRPGDPPTEYGSPEYLAKKQFMHDLVALLHELGAPELARQYEWSTCKSQPNALKRLESDPDPTAGLTAIDFRAGLALLPFLPMSPGDVKLILKGLARGSLVQFDRGDVASLRRYVAGHPRAFAGMEEALDELDHLEQVYRHSQLDITHNAPRLLHDGGFWRQFFRANVEAWRIRGRADDATADRLQASKPGAMLFAMLGMLATASRLIGVVGAVWQAVLAWQDRAPWWWVAPWLVIAIAGPPLLRIARDCWGRADLRRHYANMLSRPGYLMRALKGMRMENIIRWCRDERISDARALRLAESFPRYALHFPLAHLPVFLHRLLTDAAYGRDIIVNVLVRPVRLYFNAELREQWLRDMVAEGRRRHMLTDRDAEQILARVHEPFIQKYLQSLAVHVCTLPVTQVVSVIIAGWFYFTHPELSDTERAATAAGILAMFQVVPISPGSLTRGLYVLYLVIRERNFKDYNIAVFLGFFKYVGYLAFPIQMAYRYPVLARFMAAHWATGAVHVVPVFGEHGALLEHWVFDQFYNWPLTVRRRMLARALWRRTRPARAWHAPLVALGVALGLGAMDVICRQVWGVLPTLREAWPAVLVAPAIAGVLATLPAGGASLSKRVRLIALTGLGAALLWGCLRVAILFSDPAVVEALGGAGPTIYRLIRHAGWAGFFFTLIATLSGLLTEIRE